ncbi:SHUGOSHIN 1 [Cardamine amara subsp. amara]|uniref:SHUGOSHIN 1 n=1 Tax=Cardamine amara subsp. amara TaxID=228776 RepID=A0ABD0ZC03_CARAN
MLRATLLTVGDHAGEGVATNKAKGEKMVLEPPMNSAQRRKLGDITNLQNQKKLMNQGAKQQQQAILVSSKENFENLQKENMRLMKAVVERDGIKSELQKLRINFQKVQQQNLLLAQANTRILAEFNLSKDQLQHELGCKNGLVMARKILLKEKTLPCTLHSSEVKAPSNAYGGACKTFQPNGADHKNGKIKQQSSMKCNGLNSLWILGFSMLTSNDLFVSFSASESSNVNSLHINEKTSNKRRVSAGKNPANSEVLDIIGRLGETCQMEDNIDNRKLVSDGDNAADKKDFVLDSENHINDNVQSKRYCAGRQSISSKTPETSQTENLQKVFDAKEIEETARFPLRRHSARLKSQEPEPSESFRECIETARRRRSAMFNIQELGVVIPNLNGLHDDQEIAAKAGCSASEQSIGSKPEAIEPYHTKETTGKSRLSLRRQSARFNFQELSVTENLNGLHDDQMVAANPGYSASEQSIVSKPEAVEPHDTKETTGKSRVSSRRQCGNVKSQRAIKESADPPLHDDIVEESSQISYSVSMELKRETKNHSRGDEAEDMRKTCVGRPVRQAAGKIKSYKEASLKEKMRS